MASRRASQIWTMLIKQVCEAAFSHDVLIFLTPHYLTSLSRLHSRLWSRIKLSVAQIFLIKNLEGSANADG